MLQSLLNCLEQYPDMELAAVARQVGLTECLKNEKIAASAVDVTDSQTTEVSLLQGAKVRKKTLGKKQDSRLSWLPTGASHPEK